MRVCVYTWRVLASYEEYILIILILTSTLGGEAKVKEMIVELLNESSLILTDDVIDIIIDKVSINSQN